MIALWITVAAWAAVVVGPAVVVVRDTHADHVRAWAAETARAVAFFRSMPRFTGARS